MTSMKFPIYNFNFILILTLILWTRLGKRELLDRAIYFNLNIIEMDNPGEVSQILRT